MLGVVNIDRRAETAPFDLNRVNLQRLLPQFHLPKQACRKLGAGEACATQFLADKLTLSQPWEAHYAHHITTCPPSCDGPASYERKVMTPSTTTHGEQSRRKV